MYDSVTFAMFFGDTAEDANLAELKWLRYWVKDHCWVFASCYVLKNALLHLFSYGCPHLLPNYFLNYLNSRILPEFYVEMLNVFLTQVSLLRAANVVEPMTQFSNSLHLDKTLNYSIYTVVLVNLLSCSAFKWLIYYSYLPVPQVILIAIIRRNPSPNNWTFYKSILMI